MEDRFLNPTEVRKKLGGISKTTLWRMVQRGTIPEPIQLGARTPVYKQSWIDELLSVEPGTKVYPV